MTTASTEMTKSEKIKMYEELLDRYIKQWKRYQKLAKSYHKKANHMKSNWVDETMKKLQQAKNDLSVNQTA